MHEEGLIDGRFQGSKQRPKTSPSSAQKGKAFDKAPDPYIGLNVLLLPSEDCRPSFPSGAQPCTRLKPQPAPGRRSPGQQSSVAAVQRRCRPPSPVVCRHTAAPAKRLSASLTKRRRRRETLWGEDHRHRARADPAQGNRIRPSED